LEAAVKLSKKQTKQACADARKVMRKLSRSERTELFRNGLFMIYAKWKVIK
jgi:hypothetical protein